MARKTFFSFHYKRDVWRVSQVRNSNVVANDDKVGFIDDAEWEKIEREGREAIKRWINAQIKGTTVTVVLIGAETAEREWVDYEIRRSWEQGNGILGIYIDKVLDSDRKPDRRGKNPLDQVVLKTGKPLSSICKTYCWVDNNGRENLGKWIEQAYSDREEFKGETGLIDGDDKTETGSGAAIAKAAVGPVVINSPSRPWARR